MVPVGTSSGPVHVTTIGGSTAGPTFTLDPSPQPTVKSFKPTSAHVGDTITISGKYFYGTSAVKVNGVNFQSFVIVSSTKITAVVAGGNTTGTISVTTPGGTATTVTNLTIS